jgi:hypothetical protein
MMQSLPITTDVVSSNPASGEVIKVVCDGDQLLRALYPSSIIIIQSELSKLTKT